MKLKKVDNNFLICPKFIENTGIVGLRHTQVSIHYRNKNFVTVRKKIIEKQYKSILNDKYYL